MQRFTIALILAGADKFFSAMIDWRQYLAPALGIWLAFVPRRAAY